MGSKTESKINFKFMDPFEEDSLNGLCISNTYLPEEIITNILSCIPPKDLLLYTLVCKKWCNIIKSQNFWMNIYNKRYPNKAKKLPWYVYYCFFTTDNFKNLIQNGNGQNKFKFWKIIRNGGDHFGIEAEPVGVDPLPLNVPEFYGYKSCFVTSFQECTKFQEISLKNKRLLHYIVAKYMPHIYASDWVAGRNDCECMYKLILKGCPENYKYIELDDFYDEEEEDKERSLGTLFYLENTIKDVRKEWQKIELVLKEYNTDVTSVVFEHSGRDNWFWKGHYGSKMAGAVLRFVFDSIEPLEDDLLVDKNLIEL